MADVTTSKKKKNSSFSLSVCPCYELVASGKLIKMLDRWHIVTIAFHKLCICYIYIFFKDMTTEHNGMLVDPI